MTRIEKAPLSVGIILGLLAGAVTGMVAGAAGALVGLAAGFVAGLVAGTAMRRDEGRRAARSRELASIIGVHGGSLGAGPVSMPVPAEEAARQAWVDEWLTPPPPLTHPS